jgi:hypothetical protein
MSSHSSSGNCGMLWELGLPSRGSILIAKQWQGGWGESSQPPWWD